MYRIKFEHIKGKSNVLADTLSRLISIGPRCETRTRTRGLWVQTILLWETTQSIQLHSQWDHHRPGSIEVHDADITEPITTYSIPLPSFKLHKLQESDEKLHWLHPRIRKGHLADSSYFIDKEDDLLQWRILDNLQDFEPVVLPDSLISTALLLTHDHTGHNGFRRTYAALKQLYYWKGMRKDVAYALQTLPGVCKAEGGED